MLIFKFRIDNLIICFSNNLFVNNLCAAETYAISFFKINVIFAFFIFFISLSLFSVDFQKFVSFDRKKILNLRILSETTKLIFSAIFCNEKTSNFVIITIIFFFLIFETFFIFTLCSDSFDAFFIETDFHFFARIDFECGMTFFFQFVCSKFFSLLFYFFSIHFFSELERRRQTT